MKWLLAHGVDRNARNQSGKTATELGRAHEGIVRMLAQFLMWFPPGTIIRRYAMSCDSLIPFNCLEFAVAYSKPLSVRILAITATSSGDVPVPLNSRIGATLFDSVRVQPGSASHAMQDTNRPLLILLTIMRGKLQRSMKLDNSGPSLGAGATNLPHGPTRRCIRGSDNGNCVSPRPKSSHLG